MMNLGADIETIEGQCLLYFFSPTCPKTKFREKKIHIYSYKFFPNFDLSESSFTCPGFRVSGLA